MKKAKKLGVALATVLVIGASFFVLSCDGNVGGENAILTVPPANTTPGGQENANDIFWGQTLYSSVKQNSNQKYVGDGSKYVFGNDGTMKGYSKVYNSGSSSSTEVVWDTNPSYEYAYSISNDGKTIYLKLNKMYNVVPSDANDSKLYTYDELVAYITSDEFKNEIYAEYNDFVPEAVKAEITKEAYYDNAVLRYSQNIKMYKNQFNYCAYSITENGTPYSESMPNTTYTLEEVPNASDLVNMLKIGCGGFSSAYNSAADFNIGISCAEYYGYYNTSGSGSNTISYSLTNVDGSHLYFENETDKSDTKTFGYTTSGTGKDMVLKVQINGGTTVDLPYSSTGFQFYDVAKLNK